MLRPKFIPKCSGIAMHIQKIRILTTISNSYRYLDLFEAIEDGNADALDNSDFVETDIPLEVPLPETPHLPKDQHEAIKVLLENRQILK